MKENQKRGFYGKIYTTEEIAIAFNKTELEIIKIIKKCVGY